MFNFSGSFIFSTQNQSDSKALKAFIRYKGLSLLWSWMVDTPAKDMVFRSEVKYLVFSSFLKLSRNV